MDNNFNSIERLMEFGMGMAVAQQMVNTMNYAMTNMNVPGVGTIRGFGEEYPDPDKMKDPFGRF